MTNTVRVWDLPTRLFHWSLVACVIGSVASGYIGGGLIAWHARLGYAVLVLLLFRIVWGLIGGHWSRFSSFVRGPGSVLAYVRGQVHPDRLVGHNPLGALSVLAMLLVLLAQVGSGLVSDDEISFTGPLNRFVAGALALKATWYHKEVGQLLIIALVILHIGAVLFYLLKKKDNLVRPMLSGDKRVTHLTVSSRDDLAARTGALILLGLCIGAVVWVVSLGG